MLYHITLCKGLYVKRQSFWNWILKYLQNVFDVLESDKTLLICICVKLFLYFVCQYWKCIGFPISKVSTTNLMIGECYWKISNIDWDYTDILCTYYII